MKFILKNSLEPTTSEFLFTIFIGTFIGLLISIGLLYVAPKFGLMLIVPRLI